MPALDPRTKLLLALSASVTAVLVDDPRLLLGLALLALSPWAVSGRWHGGSRVVIRLLPIVVFAVISWGLFESKGPVAFSVGPISVTAAGIERGIAAGLRILVMAGSAMALVEFLPFGELVAALSRMHLPRGLAFGVGMTLWFIPAIALEHASIRDAQRARGYELDRGNLVHRLYQQLTVAVPMLLRALQIGQSVALAASVYGLRFDAPATTWVERRWGWVDAVAAVVALAGVGLAIGVW